ncbi:hypothetical protein F4818DRAFT_402202 [Hypoxylon cercidicola]|nr:hypothetical protein F4818DRAFT_402202 [Hypoxylon cercidicola]
MQFIEIGSLRVETVPRHFFSINASVNALGFSHFLVNPSTKSSHRNSEQQTPAFSCSIINMADEARFDISTQSTVRENDEFTIQNKAETPDREDNNCRDHYRDHYPEYQRAQFKVDNGWWRC